MHEGRIVATPAGRAAPGARLGGPGPDTLAMLAAAVLAVALVTVVPCPLSPDVSGQLWVAHHLRYGARLYVDIDEVNPPLWFWLAVPIDRLAAVAGIAAERVMVAAVGVATLASLLATGRLLDGPSAPRRRALLAYAALILLVMPVRDIAQREQLALIGALPYCALAAARRQGRAVSLWLALAVGLGAAVGFALKHYFLGVPLLLELWLAAGHRRGWRPLRPETLALAGAGLSYAAAILIVTPAYLTAMVPALRLAYGAVGAGSASAMFRLAQLVWLATLAAILPQHRALRHGAAPLASAMLIAAIGFAAAWAIQHKGWPYQGIAVTGCLALAFAALLAEAWERVGAPVRLIAATVLLLPLVLALTPTRAAIDAKGDVAPALAGLRPGDGIAVVSTEGTSGWPATIGRGFRLSSRYGSYWMLPAVDAAGARDPRVARFGREVVRRTIVDYRCLPPVRIIFVRPKVSGPDAPASRDPLAYFMRDPDFARLLGHYRRVMRYGMIDAWQIAAPLDPLPAQQCRRGV